MTRKVDLKVCDRWDCELQKPLKINLFKANKEVERIIQSSFGNGVSYMNVDSDGVKELHAEQVIDNSFAFEKTLKDRVIEMVESHYGSGKAMQVADILKED